MRRPQLPITPLLISLILGYLIHAYFEKMSPLQWGVSLLGILFYFLGRTDLLRSLGLYILMLCAGFALRFYYYQLPENHYSKSTSKQEILLAVEEALPNRGKTKRYYARVLQNREIPLQGKVLLLLLNTEGNKALAPGDVLFTSASFQPIPKAAPIDGFNYANYLKQLKISDQLLLFPKDYVLMEENFTNLKIWAQKARAWCLNKLESSGLPTASKKFIAAFVWGERHALDEAQLEAYAKAGAVHLLAISGLHIGLLTFFLSFLLGPLRRLPYGILLQQFIVVGFLWGYALLTGFLPSVVRAVTMFSLLAVLHFRKQLYYPLNTVLVSAFFLLVVYPPYLFSVGFQMSYSAVIGILIGMERLKNLWNPKQKILRFLWNLSAVSLCAQIAVAPWSIFYFHQFPGLFFITNLLLLPAFGILLGGSYLLMLCSLVQIEIPFLTTVHSAIINYYESVVQSIAAQETFLFDGLRLYWWEVLLSYILLFILVKSRRFFSRRFWCGASCLVVIIGTVILLRKAKENSREFWIVKNYGATVLAHKNLTKLHLWVNDSLPPTAAFKTKLKTYFSANSSIETKLPHFFIYGKRRILIVADTLGFSFKEFAPTHLIIEGNPKVNFNRLLEQYQPEQVIISASTPNWLVKQWKASCTRYAVSCHDLATAGSFRIIP